MGSSLLYENINASAKSYYRILWNIGSPMLHGTGILWLTHIVWDENGSPTISYGITIYCSHMHRGHHVPWSTCTEVDMCPGQHLPRSTPFTWLTCTPVWQLTCMKVDMCPVHMYPSWHVLQSTCAMADMSHGQHVLWSTCTLVDMYWGQYPYNGGRMLTRLHVDQLTDIPKWVA